MSTGAQSFYSTPAFELFRRGLTTQTVKKFRGIDAFQSLATMTPDKALDCMNVMVPGWGGLSKFRLPQALSQAVVPNPGSGPAQFVDFQQGNGTRQVVAAFSDNSLWYFTWNAAGTALNPGILIDRGAADAPPWSMVESNNILFMANGQRMMKWTGLAFQNWGIVAPVAAPTIGGTLGLSSVQRAGNVVTFTILNTGPERQTAYFKVGDRVTVVVGADASYNGNFVIASVVTPGLTYTYAQVGANSGPFPGELIYATSSGEVPNATAARVGGVATYNFPVNLPIEVGPSNWVGVEIVVTGFADATFNGTFTVIAASGGFGGTTQVQVSQVGLPDTVAAGTGDVATGVTAATAKSYAYAWENSFTTHVSNISPSVTIQGPFTNRIIPVTANNSVDPQVDTVLLFATLDGGGDFFLDTAIGTNGPILSDFSPDDSLDEAVQGPLINNPPPVGKYLAVGQSRIFIGNLVGGTNFIAYSGYEQILFGRPEESFPPNNRLFLEIGADSVNGLGILNSGVVGFGATKRMYMLRGNVEDITLAAPIQFSAFLQELPWDMGTMCHQSIQPTPFGLIFLGTDRTVQLFNPGSTLTSTAASLQDISAPVYPILRRMTQGIEALSASAYFNWLERDWYGITFPIDGSASNNYTLFWSLNLAGNELDIFPCSLGMDFMATLSTSKFQRLLTFASAGQIFNLPVSQDTVNGVLVPNIIPATNGNLGAFWRGGYFGNESPVRSKMYKRGLLITDQPGFQVTKRLVDNRTNTFTNPKVLGPDKVRGDSQFSIGQRANRCSIEIIFPQQDVSCNVMELTVGEISTSDRM